MKFNIDGRSLTMGQMVDYLAVENAALKDKVAELTTHNNVSPPLCVHCQRVIDLTCDGGKCSHIDRFLRRKL